jgi:DNA-binding transcriptional ArsR family regulator
LRQIAMLSEQEIKKVRKYLNGRDEEFARIFKMFSDPNRCKIFRTLAKERRLSVGDSAKVLDISLSLASQHLKILLRHGLLKKEKLGRSVYYELNRKAHVVTSILKAIK